ncbi:MAG TPA: amino acid transport protein [Thermoanaerobaculia bacterium]|nr:amino acid transport protein [Thermoanaerobaculia bacterium]
MDSGFFLILCVIFGSVGTGYFVYGKKQAKATAMIAGVALCAFPYFLDSPWAVLAVGVVLMIAPFLFSF